MRDSSKDTAFGEKYWVEIDRAVTIESILITDYAD
jgi:hypothetical protein